MKNAKLSSKKAAPAVAPKLPNKLPTTSKALTKNAKLPMSTKATTASKMPSKQPTIGGAKDKPSSKSDDQSEIYFRGKIPPDAEKKASDYNGLFVIPKILLEPAKPSDDMSFRAQNAPEYQMVSAVARPAGQSMARSRFERPHGFNSERELSRRSSASTRFRSRRTSPPHRRPDDLSRRSTDSGGLSQEIEQAKQQKKKQRKFIQRMLIDDEHAEAPCCPRMGILTGIWIFVAVFVALILKYALVVEFFETTIAMRDNASCFVEVFLVD